ncbi:MAG: PQQ-dependent sugar dehydrogenase [Rhodothermales bacterium]
MRITRGVAAMSVVALLLVAVEVAYLTKIFYFGQFKILAYKHAPGLFLPEKDFHHTPLLGCSIPKENNIHTHFFHVEFTSQEIPTKQTDAGFSGGGGMASYGNHVLLIDKWGALYQIIDDSATRLNIQTPDTGLDLFLQRSDVSSQTGDFKFLDVLVIGNDLFVSYVKWNDENSCYTLTVDATEVFVIEEEISPANGTWRNVFQSSPCLPATNMTASLSLHVSGGRMAQLNQTDFLLTVGDFATDNLFPQGSDPQRVNNDYGKVIRINAAAGTKEIYSLGHRNPQGITIDRDGRIWAVEHGPRGGDELNLIEFGGNYGWPKATLGTSYDTTPLAMSTDFARHSYETEPVFSWIPSRGVSNLIQIQGFDPAWDGDLLVGTMGMTRLYRLRTRKDRVLFSEPICIGRRVRYLHQHTDGMIYVWTDDDVLYTITGPDKTEQNTTAQTIKQLSACLECHGIDGGTSGPALSQISSKDPEYISAYLKDPQRVNPQAQMPALSLTDNDIEEIITVLQQVR